MLRLTRLRLTPQDLPTWNVIGQPFRLVQSIGGWLVVPLDDDARRLLSRHDLLARPFRTRTAALEALGTVLAIAAANRRSERLVGARRRAGIASAY